MSKEDTRLEWANVRDGAVDVPDDLMPLFNSIGTQMRFHTISGKSEVETCAHILRAAQTFFKANPHLLTAGERNPKRDDHD